MVVGVIVRPGLVARLALAGALVTGCAGNPAAPSNGGAAGNNAAGSAGAGMAGVGGGNGGAAVVGGAGAGAGTTGIAGAAGSSASGTTGAAGSSGIGGRGGAAAAGGRGGVTGVAGSAGTMGAAGRGGAGGATAADVVTTFHNGGFWNDAASARIEAHGGGFIKVGDTWYWVGEDKSHNSGNFRGVNIYASKDLGNWELRNAVITRASAPDLMAADRIIERPKIVYNDATGQFVMWLHWEGQNYATAEAGVFTSPTVDGDYTLRSHFRPASNMSRDDTLFKDDDGKAYFISAANENADLMLYELADDYLSIRRTLLKLWTSKREAPAMFKQNGRYFIITSAATGWDPNQAQYASATNIAGPWSALTNLGNNTTYDTQSTYVIPVQGSQATTFIYAGDRWQDPDLVGSKYIWLPLKVSGSTLALDYYADWQLNVTTGVWSVNDGYLPQAGWTLLYASSEETSGEDGRATNAFDNSTSTIWHTKYSGTTAAYPHEIQIDLGATYALDGFRYLPRQDKDANGTIAQYQFYASTDRTSWGTAVASGTFGADRGEKRVMFTRKTARYIRLVALSEVTGMAFASVAELDLIGAAQ